jgi:hypothetical protein
MERGKRLSESVKTELLTGRGLGAALRLCFEALTTVQSSPQS